MIEHIEVYRKTTAFNSDNVTTIEIDRLYFPLNNVPKSVTKIAIHVQIDVLRSEHEIPIGCELIIEKTHINKIATFDKLKESDYQDITAVDLAGNGYSEIPKEIPDVIFNFTNLHELTLYRFNIKDISDKISCLENLEDLSFESNRIEIVPDVIGTLKKLLRINLSNNQIHSVSKKNGIIKKSCCSRYTI